MFTQQHYIAIARVLYQHVSTAASDEYRASAIAVARDMADMLEADNPNFKRDVFLDAAGVER